jgi:hypothetical protein
LLSLSLSLSLSLFLCVSVWVSLSLSLSLSHMLIWGLGVFVVQISIWCFSWNSGRGFPELLLQP